MVLRFKALARERQNIAAMLNVLGERALRSVPAPRSR